MSCTSASEHIPLCVCFWASAIDIWHSTLCLLLNVCCQLPVAECLLLMLNACCLMPVAECLLPDTCCQMPVAGCLLLNVCHCTPSALTHFVRGLIFSTVCTYLWWWVWCRSQTENCFSAWRSPDQNHQRGHGTEPADVMWSREVAVDSRISQELHKYTRLRLSRRWSENLGLNSELSSLV